MTAKEYLSQGYRLDLLIQFDIEEAKDLHTLAYCVSAIQYEEDRVQTSMNMEAPFVKTMEELAEQENKIKAEIRILSELKGQIRKTIEALPDKNERLILKSRYLKKMTWNQIGEMLHADRTTVYRWHNNGLRHIVLPDNPICIDRQ